MRTGILFEDAHMMVIHKPAGLAVQSGRIGQMDCESELKNYLTRKGERPFVGIVHRLDQPVEGLLVIGKTKAATGALSTQLQRGSLNKSYRAVVHLEGDTPEDFGSFTDYMVKVGPVAAVVPMDTPDAKKAVLEYEILQKSGDLALVLVHIETGRFHQIRCQMAHHQMPLLGDAKYGSSASKELGHRLGITQTALCADFLQVKHPVTGVEMEFSVQPANKAFSKFQ